jgi:hypothetical protein
MGSDAQTQLQTSLRIEENYNADEAPQPNDPDISDLLWDELLDAAREDGNLLSFFIVSEASGNASELLYVSADWPSAETFAKERIATAQADGGLIVN